MQLALYILFKFVVLLVLLSGRIRTGCRFSPMGVDGLNRHADFFHFTAVSHRRQLDYGVKRHFNVRQLIYISKKVLRDCGTI